MTWTFDDTLSESKDQIRMLIGDIDVSDPQLSDEALIFFSANGESAYTAAASAARALAAKYSREANSKSVGSMSVSYNRAQNYLSLADMLEAQSYNPGMILAAPQVGGISKADKSSQEQETDRVPPTFTRNDFEIPGSTEYHRQPTESQAWGP